MSDGVRPNVLKELARFEGEVLYCTFPDAVRYRAPSRVNGRLSRWIGVPLTSLGLAPHRYPVFRVDDRFREG